MKIRYAENRTSMINSLRQFSHPKYKYTYFQGFNVS